MMPPYRAGTNPVFQPKFCAIDPAGRACVCAVTAQNSDGRRLNERKMTDHATEYPQCVHAK